jgi:ribonuclease T1
MLGRRTLVCVALWLAAAATPVGARDSPLPDGPGVVTVAELPAEAVATLETIRRGGPFRYRKDGIVFGNRERLLPRQPRGYYTEYTVRTPGSRDRGARRIVAGGDPKTSGEFYYTDDHYRSFRRIRE